ncbi:hypothetical protein SCP_1101080 [Sparassis crispa]|uniref:Uncharacterized protein n=1 Tax=Sparassis crispa TaxID=139825 RepID=A0A401GZ52_9APHY|nr:hypothetical protein SCP_1101080 [Sparassis crispa]GBE87432.1 hypothetical protein SCP_1101080 [Sparassis crispa]
MMGMYTKAYKKSFMQHLSSFDEDISKPFGQYLELSYSLQAHCKVALPTPITANASTPMVFISEDKSVTVMSNANSYSNIDILTHEKLCLRLCVFEHLSCAFHLSHCISHNLIASLLFSSPQSSLSLAIPAGNSGILFIHSEAEDLIGQPDFVPVHVSVPVIDPVPAHIPDMPIDPVPVHVSVPAVLDSVLMHVTVSVIDPILMLIIDPIPVPVVDPVLMHVPAVCVDPVLTHVSASVVDSVPSHVSLPVVDIVPVHVLAAPVDFVPAHASAVPIDPVPVYVSVPAVLDPFPVHVTAPVVDPIPMPIINPILTSIINPVPGHVPAIPDDDTPPLWLLKALGHLCTLKGVSGWEDLLVLLIVLKHRSGYPQKKAYYSKDIYKCRLDALSMWMGYGCKFNSLPHGMRKV